MIEHLHSKDFSEQLNTSFQLQTNGPEPLAMTLIEVSERNDSPRLEQFVLLFRGPLSPCLPQRIYPLEHGQLGSLSLFLVPLGPDGEGMTYQAVINRFRR